MVHNVYIQISGHKRFIIFPPRAEFSLYTFTRLHPSSRQTQIDLRNSSSWNQFPDFTPKASLEVVLGPGDVLYVPPFYFHEVTVCTDPTAAFNETSAVSISVSVHTSSIEAEVRTDMIEKALQLPVPREWSLDERICALRIHFSGLFLSRDEGTAFVGSILNASYSHFHLDEANAVGLHAKIKQARKDFPRGLKCTKKLDVAFQSSGEFVRRKAQQATNMESASMLLSEYVQDTAGLVLDNPIWVDPFFRWLQGNWVN